MQTTKPRVAVMGCGYWGKNLVRNFHALGALELACDPSPVGRASARQIAPEVAVTDSFERTLDRAELDAVAIAAPAALHYTLAKAALLAGKDVFVEKPLCLQVSEAEELVQLAARLERVLMVGHLLQYHPCIQALQELLAKGRLGKLHYLISNRLNLGKIRQEENALWSFAPHDISVMLSLVNHQLPEQVRCSGGSYLSEGVADTTLTAMRFHGGVRAHIFVSWLNPFKEQKLTVVGSAGMAVFDDTRPWTEKLMFFPQHITWEHGQVPTPSKVRAEAVVPAESEPLQEECRHFLDCCRERRLPRTDGQEGLRVLSVLQAAQRSLDSDGDAVAPANLRLGPADVAVLPSAEYSVHPSAVVDAGAAIGKGTKIWHFSHVLKGARIGERCVLGQNVNVDGGAVLGNNVKVQNNVSIYTGVQIEDDVFLGPSCVLTNVTNPRAQVNRHALYEQTVIKRGATIGANATLVCGITIGRYAFIAAGAVVARDVPDYALIVGNPARVVGWMSRHGHRLKPGPNGEMICPESGFRYAETVPGHLRCLDLDEEAPLPAALTKGSRTYDEFKQLPAA
jgi:UDP-2-acetamido-3-amino-2,3-dideoxy-glucuronate N-acetyltransferase